MASKLQRGYDDDRFETIVNRNLVCLICFNVLREPVMCRRNQHYFCRGCLTEHLRRNSQKCPTCAEELSVETLCDVPKIVKDYLDELNIRCEYYDRGCRELAQLQNLKYHVTECGFTPVVCGNQGCGETISRRDRTYHESELCEFRKLKCHNCGEICTKMTAMDTKMANVDTKMANVDTKMEMTSTKVRHIDTRMKTIQTKMASTEMNLADVNTKVTNIQTKIANMDTKITNMDMRNTDTKMTNTEMNLADVNTKMRNMETKIANMETTMRIMDTKLEKNTEMNLAGVNTKMKHMETRVANIDKRVANFQANVEEKFEVVNDEMKEIKLSLTEVKDGFDQLKEAVLDKIESKDRNKVEITTDGSGTASDEKEKQHIFVAGGYRRNSVELFNYRQRLWSLLKPMPEMRFSASSFVHNDQVTLAGGYCSGYVNNMIQMNILPLSDLAINWIDFAPKLPARMSAHSCVVDKDSLFVTGGYNADQDLYSDLILEVQLKPPYTVKSLSKMSEPRADHSTVLCDDGIFIFGGTKTGKYKDNLSSVVSYDIKKKKCQELPQLPYPVSEMATVKWSENAMIIGGADKDGKALNNAILYNIKTGNSHMLPPMLHKRKACMAVVIQKTIVVLGGRDEKGNNLKSVEQFSFDRYTWEKLPCMKEARSFAAAVVI